MPYFFLIIIGMEKTTLFKHVHITCTIQTHLWFEQADGVWNIVINIMFLSINWSDLLTFWLLHCLNYLNSLGPIFFRIIGFWVVISLKRRVSVSVRKIIFLICFCQGRKLMGESYLRIPRNIITMNSNDSTVCYFLYLKIELMRTAKLIFRMWNWDNESTIEQFYIHFYSIVCIISGACLGLSDLITYKCKFGGVRVVCFDQRLWLFTTLYFLY